MKTHYIWGSILIFLIDRVTKIIVIKNKFFLLKDLVVFKNILHIKYVENSGVAFSMFSNSILATIILPIISIIILYILIQNNKSKVILFYIILGSFLGNFVDRLVYSYVVDFIYFPFIPFFVCNIADIFIFFSTILLFKKENSKND